MYSIEQNKITFKDDYYELNFVEIIQNHNETNETKIDEIYFGKYFNQDISLLPQYITKITFHNLSKFNKCIDFLPRELNNLSLGYDFNQRIDNLPYKLTHLKLGNKFNQPIDNLPNKLTYLDLGWDFNQQINNLPDSIIHLTLSRYFNQCLDFLPKELNRLTVVFHFDKPLNLPNKLIKFDTWV